MGKEMIVHSKSKAKIAFSPIDPADCGYEECAPGKSFGPAVRTYCLLHFVVSGRGYFTSRNGRYALSEDDIFIIRPYEVTYYEADESEPWSYIWLGFSSDRPLPERLIANDTIHAPELAELFREAAFGREVNVRMGEAYEIYLAGLILRLFGRLLAEEATASPSTAEYVGEAVRIMENEYHRRLNASEIAARLHLNRSYFSLIFKEATGLPPHRYLENCRMKRAAELLVIKGLPPSVVALSVGYPDQFAFSRAFKRHYRISPTEYKKQYSKLLPNQPKL